jgi:hypothetical protein
MASVDQGLTITFISAQSNITPASPQTEDVNGGASATAHGWYGAPIFAMLVPGKDTQSEIFAQIPNDTISGLDPGPTLFFKMRAKDSLAGYVTWISSPAPDFAGAGYSGGTPTPVGSMVPGSAVVAAEWQG